MKGTWNEFKEFFKENWLFLLLCYVFCVWLSMLCSNFYDKSKSVRQSFANPKDTESAYRQLEDSTSKSRETASQLTDTNANFERILEEIGKTKSDKK